MVREIDPSVTSGQDALTLVLDIESAAGSDIVTGTFTVQRLASVTVIVYDAPARPLKVPETWNAPLFNLYIYGAVPPEPDIVTDPFVEPKHETFVWLVIGPAKAAAGCVMVTRTLKVQRFAS